MSIHVDYQVCDRAACLSLSREEKRNAFDDHTISELHTYLKSAIEDDSVDRIVLKAKGDHFSAGGDLAWMRRMASYGPDENQADAMRLANLMFTLYQSPKPTLALVQGSVFGGGCGLVACCDTAIASQCATFCLSEVKLGLIPAVIGPYVVAAMGERQARHLMISAERFDASKAYQLNLVHALVEGQADLEGSEKKWHRQLSQNCPIAMKTAKQFCQAISYRNIGYTLVQESANEIAQLRATPAAQEGLSAFLEKRPPQWITEHEN